MDNYHICIYKRQSGYKVTKKNDKKGRCLVSFPLSSQPNNTIIASAIMAKATRVRLTLFLTIIISYFAEYTSFPSNQV